MIARNLLLTAGLLCLPLAGKAHYLWIESETPTEARVYFGEFVEDVREKAGGRLDEREKLEGKLAVADKATALKFEKKPDHFAVKLEQPSGWLLVQDLADGVKDWTKSDIGIVKPMFYARAAVANKPAPAKSALLLDILPTGQDANQLRVVFKDQPLANAKVLVSAPNLWMQELKTDDAGQVKISTPFPGRYVIEVIHKERTPGEFEGKAYEAIRHRATYSQVY